jgi:uncharacterized protein (DUF488 family)
MATPAGAVEIYTIGHGNARAATIVELLTQYSVRILVDVRSAPYSRHNPQFNRETFSETLTAAGIAYRYEGKDLGGRPSDPTCYRTAEVPDGETDREDFLKLVDYAEVAKRPWYLAGIERLIATAGEARTAIMCAEEDPRNCHRSHLIAQTLLERQVSVFNIRKSGNVEQEQPQPKQLSLF